MARNLQVKIIGDASSYNRALRQAGGSTSGFGRTLSNVGKAAGLAAAGGIFALGVGIKKSVDAAKEADISQRRLQTGLNALGIDYEKHADTIDRVIQKQSRLAAIDDEELQDSFTGLVRVTKDVNKALELNAIAADISRAKGIELSAATAIVTKAALGQVGVLKRQGIEITKVTDAQDALGKGATAAEKKQAKAADEQATRLKAIGALQELFAGQAKSYGDSSSGAADKFRVALENLQESAGKGLLPVLAQVTGAAAGFLDRLSQAEGFKAKLSIVWEGVSGAVADLATALTDAVRGIDWGPIGEAIGEGVSQALEKTKDVGTKFGVDLESQINSVDWRGIGRRVGEEITGGVGQGMEKGRGGGGFFETLGRLTVTWYGAMAKFGAGLAESLADPVARGIAALPNLIGQTLARAFQAGARAIQSAASNWQTWAKQLGTAVVKGAVAGLEGLVIAVFGKLAQASASVRRFIGPFYSAAISLGAAIVDGAIAGLAGFASRLGSAIGNAAQSAIAFGKRAIGAESPSKLARDELGKPLGEGVIQGWLISSAQLPEKMGEKLKAAIERGRQVILSSRSAFTSAFEGLSARILRAFDAETNAMETASEKRLREIDERREMEDLLSAQSSAQARLNQLQAEGGSGEDIAAAQRDVERAGEDIEIVKLRQQAEDERTQLNSRREEQRLFLEERLRKLSEHFAKEGATVKGALASITKLMKTFGVDFATAGALVGAAFVRGLKNSISGAAVKAGNLEKLIERVAAEIKIPELDTGGTISRTGMAVVHRGETITPSGRTMSVPPVINVYVSGSVQTERDLVYAIRDGLNKVSANNAGNGLA